MPAGRASHPPHNHARSCSEDGVVRIFCLLTPFHDRHVTRLWTAGFRILP
jgi:hypothetical protein